MKHGDSGVKTRTLVRKQGWTPVSVDALKIAWDGKWWEDKEDKDHYRQIVEWCDELIGKENYVSVLQDGTSAHNVKRFVFKYPKHATLFRMRWLTS